MTAEASGDPKDTGLVGPAHRKVLADDPGDAKIDGLPSFQDRGLDAGREKGQRKSGADVGLGMTRVAGDVDERGASTKRARPTMCFGERSLQDRIGGRDDLARDDPGLDPAPTQGEGLRDAEQGGCQCVGGDRQFHREDCGIKPQHQLPLCQGSGKGDLAEQLRLGLNPIRQPQGAALKICGPARIRLCQHCVPRCCLAQVLNDDPTYACLDPFGGQTPAGGIDAPAISRCET